jgi:hypothetical protein
VARTWYHERGIPYRRGYLLTGPPGTSKSSFARAVAGQHNLDMYILSLTDRDLDDTALIKLLNSLNPRSLVLLEDVDVCGLPACEALRQTRVQVSATPDSSVTGVTKACQTRMSQPIPN